ncbi:hypothetical protein [Thioalkalivibrio sp. ALE16]|uniref:hypothetical protein n=1 Tax=Thioalkalivibrio sp. ALE16 TaxID=1158172 RepID=UPI00037FD3D9|nr:hypothetical protein [Thioalkalivibrio sp. ALE16]
MRYSQFHAWEPLDGQLLDTVDNFRRFIENAVACRHPENSIEYWSKPRDMNGQGLHEYLSQIHHCAVYAHPGGSEGDIIRVSLATRDGEYIPVCFAKLLGPEFEVWDITKTVAEAVNGMILYHEQPMLPRLASHFVRLNQGPSLIERPDGKTLILELDGNGDLVVSMAGEPLKPEAHHQVADKPWLLEALLREYKQFFGDMGNHPLDFVTKPVAT